MQYFFYFQGVSIYSIITFINEKYVMEMTPQRRRLVKKRIKELQEAGQLKTLTGKGITGHFRVSNKRIFKRDVINQNQHTKNRKKTSRSIPSANISQDNLATPTTNNIQSLPSIFKTPSSQEQLSPSNSIVNRMVTQAPRLLNIERNVEKRFSKELETPRSSLSKKPRQIFE